MFPRLIVRSGTSPRTLNIKLSFLCLYLSLPVEKAHCFGTHRIHSHFEHEKNKQNVSDGQARCDGLRRGRTPLLRQSESEKYLVPEQPLNNIPSLYHSIIWKAKM